MFNDLELFTDKEDEIRLISRDLLQHGCCARCTMRFLGEKRPSVYTLSQQVSTWYVYIHNKNDSQTCKRTKNVGDRSSKKQLVVSQCTHQKPQSTVEKKRIQVHSKDSHRPAALVLRYQKDRLLIESVLRWATKIIPGLRDLEYSESERLECITACICQVWSTVRKEVTWLRHVYKYAHGLYSVNNSLLERNAETTTRGHKHKLKKSRCCTRQHQHFF